MPSTEGKDETELLQLLQEEQEKTEALAHSLRSLGVDPALVVSSYKPAPPSSVSAVVKEPVSIVSKGVGWFDEDLAQKYDEMRAAVEKSGHPILQGVEVQYENVTYTLSKPAGRAGKPPTFGSKAFDCASLLWCGPCIRSRRSLGKVSKVLLNNISGKLLPGEITLVIGPPGCGKTAFLKLLAGRLKPKKRGAATLTGTVTYNGCTASSGDFSLPKVAVYIDEKDEHIPQLTVEETFDFAFQNTRGGHHSIRTDISGPKAAAAAGAPDLQRLMKFMDEHNVTVRWALSLLGLKAAKDTVIGDALLRGVSGGERRRVTSGEMMVGGASVLLMDSISTGLDSSTTYDIIEALRLTARAFDLNIVVALLQPPPEVFGLFDKVIAMAGGYVIYHGVTAETVPYFESLGFKRPVRKDPADFIVELPTSQGAAFALSPAELAESGSGSGRQPPSTPAEFAERWAESAQFASLKASMEEGVRAGSSRQRSWADSERHAYAGTWWFHTKLCLAKHWRLLTRDRTYTRTRLMMAVGVGVVVGTTFYNLDLTNTPSKFGVLYFGALFLSMSGMASIPIAFATRAVLYKQTASGFYPASADTVAQALAALPLQVVEALVFAPLVWYLPGMYPRGARFVLYLTLTIAMNCTMGQFFRMLAAFLPNYTAVQGIASVLLMLMVLFSGYIIPYAIIPKAWYFIYWPNPLAWAFRSAVILEFTSPAYSAEESKAILEQYGLPTDIIWAYAGIIVLVGEWLLCTIGTAAFLTWIRYDPADKKPIVLDNTGENGQGSAGDSAAAATVAVGATAIAAAMAAATAAVEFPKASASSAMEAPADASSAPAAAAAAGGAAALAFEPASLVFRDVWYSVPHPAGDGELDLLKGVSGYCLPGTATALMGSSGAGKTTLMDVLAGRKTGGTIKGDILINGRPKVQKTFTRVAAYCEQMDLHSPVVTVREAVEFSACMRLDAATISEAQRAAHVDQVLSALGLLPIQSQLIGGGDTGGLSIEEKKRVTIGVELAANPSLLFLDEPTSGLDARAALMVMRTVSAIAATGRTVICTIHQPSTVLFEMFDALLLLKKGGETVYFGDLGHESRKLIDYLEAIPGTPSCRPDANPATWMLETIGAGTAGKVDSAAYAVAYKTSPLMLRNKAEVDRLAAAGGPELVFKDVFAAPRTMQMKACCSRALLQYYRSPQYSFTKQVLSVVIAVAFASSFVGKEITDTASLTGRLGIFYMSLSFPGALFLGLAIPFIAAERAVYYREQASRMYKPGAYAFAYLISEIPFNVLAAFIFSSVFYYMANFSHDPGKFFQYLLCFCLYTSFQSYFGQLLVNATPSMKVAQTLSSISGAILNIFAGFMINRNAISPVWLWIYYINPQSYALQNIVTSQYHDNTTPIDAGSATVPANTFIDIFFDGTFQYSRFWGNIGALCAFIFAVRMANTACLSYLRFGSR